MTAIAVTIAGSDSSGGAGIQADLKTFSANGVFGASVLAALTAQNTKGVTGIHDVPPAFIRAQIDAVYSDLKVGATKIGMLSQPDVIRTVAEGLAAHQTGSIVLDPVMVAASGDPLLADDAVAVLIEALLPAAHIVTPNLHEAARMLGCPVAITESEMQEQAEKLIDLGARCVLLKGGRGKNEDSADLMASPGTTVWYRAPREKTHNTHGTGCTLSSAVAAGLAKGLPLGVAVASAKDYISAAIRAADRLTIGSGRGPVHHFHAYWGD